MIATTQAQVFDCEQGTEEWFAARRGVITASTFDKVLTATGKLSSQAMGLVYQTLAETRAVEDDDFQGNAHTDRGTLLEPEARAAYEFQTGRDCKTVGFVRRGFIGCSPDALVDNGGLEIKCPTGKVHLGYLDGKKIPTKYIPQVHGSMVVTGADWWDFLSYHPSFPPLLVRVHRDEYTAQLSKALDDLVIKLKKTAARLEIELY